MSQAMTAESEDLEALFDSIVSEQKAVQVKEAKPAKAKAAKSKDTRPPPAGKAKTDAEGEPPVLTVIEHDPHDNCPCPAHHGSPCPSNKLLGQVGQLTRTLHENLRALGYDKVLEKTAAAIPDARDRLAYVINMTEKAAERALNATDVVNPIQDKLSDKARGLSGDWDKLFARELSIDQFKELVGQTRGFLGEIPADADATRAQMLEIMMAQDFQDLTGQVIKKTTEIIQSLESQLLQLLLDNIPSERADAAKSLMNGPVVKADGRTDVVTSQSQVDDLLESLGF